MKAIKLIPVLAALMLCAQMLKAQDYGLYWKYKDYDGSLSLTIPRFLVDMGALFVEEREDRQWIRKIHKVRVMAFTEGQSPVTTADLNRFERKAKRRHLEELLTVKDGKIRVRILAKERNDAIRKLVILVSTPEDFAMITVKGKLRWEDISKALGKYGKDLPMKNKSKNGTDLIKIPVKRI